MFFRLGFDFSVKDAHDMTPWDRAMDNWSLFCINFMIDYTQRPLKTNYFLKGSLKFSMYDLVPKEPQKKLYEIESEYIPSKMVEIIKKRRGGYDSFTKMCMETCMLDIKNYVK
jgi:hypothetical protein